MRSIVIDLQTATAGLLREQVVVNVLKNLIRPIIVALAVSGGGGPAACAARVSSPGCPALGVRPRHPRRLELRTPRSSHAVAEIAVERILHTMPEEILATSSHFGAERHQTRPLQGHIPQSAAAGQGTLHTALCHSRRDPKPDRLAVGE